MLQHDLLEIYCDQWLGAVDAAQAQGCDLITFCGRPLADHGFKRQANAIYELVTAETLDALVVWATTLGIHIGAERLAEFCRRFDPLPIVAVEQPIGTAPVVLMENRQGMCDAVSHLIEVHGHRRIAFLRGPATHEGAQERYAGYLDALADHRLPVRPELVSAHVGPWNPTDTKAYVLGGLGTDIHHGVISGAAAHTVQLDGAWVSRLLVDPPDAIAAANDGLAVAAVSALAMSGLRIPEDVAVVGYDDSVNVDAANVEFDSGRDNEARAGKAIADTMSLTTVRAPFHELGHRAVELALALVRGDPVPAVTTACTELVVRRSCGCLPTTSGPALPLTAAGEEKLTGQLRQALGNVAAALPEDWLERLSATFLREVRGESSGAFVVLLYEFVRLGLRSSERLENWSQVLSLLRQLIGLPTASAAERARAEAVWLQADMLLSDLAERHRRCMQIVVDKRNQIVRDVGQQLITASDLAHLTAMLPGELAKVGIRCCYLASYESAGPDVASAAGPRSTARSRLLLATVDGTPAGSAAGPLTFRSTQLVPGDALHRPAPYSLVAEPLYFKDQQLGYVLFDAGPRFGWIYSALQEQLSSALHRVFMVERERAAVAALEDAHRREERQRLAGELHDSVSQALFSMTLHTRALQLVVQQGGHPNHRVARGLAELHELNQTALAEMRALIFQLRPDALHEDGLVSAIRRHAAAVAGREGLDVSVKAVADPLPLGERAETELFRVVQEALHNSVKHARAEHIEIRLYERADAARTLVVEVADDGVGFDLDTRHPGHLGLQTMRERTERLGGRFAIDSSPAGSTVRAVVPDILTGR